MLATPKLAITPPRLFNDNTGAWRDPRPLVKWHTRLGRLYIASIGPRQSTCSLSITFSRGAALAAEYLCYRARARCASARGCPRRFPRWTLPPKRHPTISLQSWS